MYLRQLGPYTSLTRDIGLLDSLEVSFPRASSQAEKRVLERLLPFDATLRNVLWKLKASCCERSSTALENTLICMLACPGQLVISKKP